MSSFSPRRVCIAATLLIAAGMNSAFGLIAGILGGGFSFDLGFLGIPIGYGVLLGSSSSRDWAVLFAGLGLLFIAGIGAWVCYDAFTGGGLLSYDSVAVSETRDTITRLPKVTVSTIDDPEGVQLRFLGVATQPIEVMIKANGFHDASIKLDRNSGEEVRVAMPPLEKGEPEDGP